MRKARVVISVAVAVFALVLITGRSAVAGQAQTAQVRVLPATGGLTPGGIVTLEVWVQDVADLYGADVSLAFDPNLLQVEDDDLTTEEVEITPGSLFDPQASYVARAFAFNDLGVITYTAVLKNPAPAVSGSGVLARVTFRAVRPGTGTIAVTRALLSDHLADDIPLSAYGATFTINGPTPTRTPSPTATRTPTVSPTPTPTRVPSSTPTPDVEERALREAAAALGWSQTVTRQPPVYQIANVPAAGHSGEAWLKRHGSSSDAHWAFLRRADTLLTSGWTVQTLTWHGHVAYLATRNGHFGSPLHEREFAFEGGIYLAVATSLDNSDILLAPDPQNVTEAVFQAGRRYYLFGDLLPSLYLPVVLRLLPPTPIPTASSTATASPTLTATYTPWPTLTASPTATYTPSPSVTPTGAVTPVASYTPTLMPSPSASPTATQTPTQTQVPSVTPTPTETLVPSVTPTPTQTLVPSNTPTATETSVPTASPMPTQTPTGHLVQLLRNGSFESDEAWAFPPTQWPGYRTVQRAHTGQWSVHLGLDTFDDAHVRYSSVEQIVDIPAGATTVELSFWYFTVSSVLNPPDSDPIYVYVLRASDKTDLFHSIWFQHEQRWLQSERFALHAWAGQRVIVRIGVKNDGLYGPTAVFVDDVELSVRVPEGTP